MRAQRERRVEQLVVRHHLVGQAEPVRLVGVDRLAGQVHLERLGLADSRGSRWVPPKPGMIPRLISGWPKVADSAAIRKSQAMASSQPPPKAIELTAAIVTVERLLHARA